MSGLIDVTVPLREGMVHYDGNPGVHLERVQSIGDHDAHEALLSHGIAAVEGLDLGAVEPGAYKLLCLPLKIVGSDGAPARAILVAE